MKKQSEKQFNIRIFAIVMCSVFIFAMIPNLKLNAYTEGKAGKMTYNSEIVSASEAPDDKIDVSWQKAGISYLPFGQFPDALNANIGIDFMFDKINMEGCDNYSLILCFGNTSNNQSWDKKGFQLVYTTQGKFYAYNCNIDKIWRDPFVAPASDSTAVNESVTPLTDSGCTINLKLINNTYNITVKNGENTYEFQFNTSAVNLASHSTLYASATLASNNNPPAAGSGISVKMTNEADYGIAAPPEGYIYSGDVFRFKEMETGFRMTRLAIGYAYERISVGKSFIIGEQPVKIDISNIVSYSGQYSLAFSFGTGLAPNNSLNYAWSDNKGIMLYLNNSGEIVFIESTTGKNNDPNTATVLAHGKITVCDYLNIEIRQNDDFDYIFKVNDNDFTVNGSCLTYSDELNISFGVCSGFGFDSVNQNITDLKYWQDNFISSDISMTVNSVSGTIPEDESITKGSLIPPEGYNLVGENYRFKPDESGLMVTHLKQGAAYERVEYKIPYFAQSGITLELKDITSRSKNYSVAVCIAPNSPLWSDKKCLMLYYDATGHMALVACTGELNAGGGALDPNEAEVLAYATQEQFNKNLTMKIKLDNGKYYFDINGMTAEVDGSYLSNAELLAFSYGINSDFKLDNGDITELQYWQSGFKNKSVTFTVAEIKGVSGIDDPIEGKRLDADAAGFRLCGEDIQLFEAENGIRVVHGASAGAWERVIYKNKFSPKNTGLSFDISDIRCKATNYSIVVKLGTVEGWYGTRGYEIHYGKSGNFLIVATDKTTNNPNIGDVAVSEIREALSDKFSLKVVLNGINYEVTVNGKTYSIPAQNSLYPVENSREVFLEFGVMNDAAVGDIDYWTNNFKRNSVSFVVTGASGMIVADNYGEEYGLKVFGNNWSISNKSGKPGLTFGASGLANEYVSLLKSFSTKKGGIDIKLTDITSADSNYSIALILSDEKSPWYDCTGYMIVYGKSGNFSISATDNSVISPNASEIAVQEKREPLAKELSVNVRLSGKDYVITVNGKEYTVKAKNKAYPLSSTDELFVSAGVFDDKTVGEYNIKSPFLKSPVSFTLASVAHNDKFTDVEEEPEEDIGEVESEKIIKSNKAEKPVKKTEVPERRNIMPFAVIACVVVLTAAVLAVIFVRKKKMKG